MLFSNVQLISGGPVSEGLANTQMTTLICVRVHISVWKRWGCTYSVSCSATYVTSNKWRQMVKHVVDYELYRPCVRMASMPYLPSTDIETSMYRRHHLRNRRWTHFTDILRLYSFRAFTGVSWWGGGAGEANVPPWNLKMIMLYVVCL